MRICISSKAACYELCIQRFGIMQAASKDQSSPILLAEQAWG